LNVFPFDYLPPRYDLDFLVIPNENNEHVNIK
jgi:hypothetical protein